VRVLVVDSDLFSAENLARLVTPHDVVIASDSSAAMLAVCCNRPDLVLFRPAPALALAERILRAMSELNDLQLIVHENPLSSEELSRLLAK
jgi:hypothetical protein